MISSEGMYVCMYVQKYVHMYYIRFSYPHPYPISDMLDPGVPFWCPGW